MLGVDAALDGVSTVDDRPMEHVFHALAHREQDLALHQVHIGDHLGYRVLNLNTRVHLDEIEPAVLVHEELDCACVHVADPGKCFAENAPDPVAHFRRHLRRWRLLQQLLMAALNAALTLAQADDIAVCVAQNLELDVARPFDILLHVQIAVAEGSRGFRLRRFK